MIVVPDFDMRHLDHRLIFDNPYIGLDAESRKEFDEAIIHMRKNGVSVVYLVCDPCEIPDYVDSIIEMEDCKIGHPIMDKEEIAGFLSGGTENYKESDRKVAGSGGSTLAPPPKKMNYSAAS